MVIKPLIILYKILHPASNIFDTERGNNKNKIFIYIDIKL